MRVYVIWLNYYNRDSDPFRVTAVLTSEDEAARWCEVYNNNYAGESSATFDTFYLDLE